MKSITEIVDTKDKEAWSEFLFERKRENQKRPLMARGYADYWEEHEAHDFHLGKTN